MSRKLDGGRGMDTPKTESEDKTCQKGHEPSGESVKLMWRCAIGEGKGRRVKIGNPGGNTSKMLLRKGGAHAIG